MNESTFAEHQLDTIHRQAKRFATRLDLPITSAKDILAQAFYQCSGWRDLEGRLRKQTLDKRLELLTALPQSNEARSYFIENRLDLAKSLSQHILTNSNLAGLLGHVQDIFAVGSNPITLEDLVPTLNLSAWEPAHIGPDPWAVVEAETIVNGTCFRLIGTRTYLPKYYDFGPEHECGEYVGPFDGMLRIVWTEPMVWYQAGLNYLNDLDAEDILLPDVELTENMARHQAWFETTLAAHGRIAEYGHDDDSLVPVFLGGQSYVVFGIPIRSGKEAERNNCVSVDLASVDDNFSQIVILHGSPACLEWISYDQKTGRHPGEYSDYFETLRQGVLQSKDLPVSVRKDGQSGLLFIRPAADFDVRQELTVDFTHLSNEVAFVLKTSNLVLIRELLSKVGVRDLMTFVTKTGTRYFALLSVPQSKDSPRLSLSFDSNSPNMIQMSNLVRSCHWKQQAEKSEFLVELAPQLMNLVDQIGKKALDVAISQGLIQRRPIEFLDELDQPPRNCRHIPQVPVEIAEALERPLDREDHLTVSFARYMRDNF